MTPAELRAARLALGEMWGLNRPLTLNEFGRILRLRGKEPGETIHNWQEGVYHISGPASVAIEALLAGFKPSSYYDEFG